MLVMCLLLQHCLYRVDPLLHMHAHSRVYTVSVPKQQKPKKKRMQQPMYQATDQTPVIVETTVIEFPHSSFETTCPFCRFTGLTRVQKNLGAQFMVCLILCIVFFWSIVGLILLCCLCCNPHNFEYTHFCVNCNREIGKRAVIMTKKRMF